jgi:hypothetical protein
MIRQSTTGQYCIHKTKVLQMEGMWLLCLIILQIIKLVCMTTWQMSIVHNRHGFFEKSIDYSDLNTTRNDRS